MPAEDSQNANSPKTRFQTVEIEFGDELAPAGQKSAPIQKLREGGDDAPDALALPQAPQKTQGDAYCFRLEGATINCKIDDWGKGFSLFGDFLQDARKYYKKTCINASYVYFFSFRPMYRELTHEQLCWYLFWRSKVREGSYPKTALSYVFLYLYEQINLSDVIGCEKAYANIVGVWKNYRAEFPRIDKYVSEWLIDFSLINRFRINLGDIGEALPDIINSATIPEIYMPGDFFKNKGNAEAILGKLSVYDYKKSKFYTEKNKELFDRHIPMMLHAALSGPEFEALAKKEADEGASLKTTRESYMGAVCAYEHKKRITVEYKNIYKSFYIRQCVTDTARCAENALRDYLGIKSKLALAAYPEQLAGTIERYKAAFLGSPEKAKGKKAQEDEAPETPEFNPDIQSAAQIEKESWETTNALVELQNRGEAAMPLEQEDADEADEMEGDGEFIAIDTGNGEDIFDILERSEKPEFADMGEFAASLEGLERKALEALMDADAENKSFDTACLEFLAKSGTMLESVIASINEKAMDFVGDVIFDTATGAIVEDYREEIERSRKR